MAYREITIEIPDTKSKFNHHRMIDLVNINNDVFHNCLDILIKFGGLGKEHAGAKGFIGWAELVQAYFRKRYPRLSNIDAMDMVLGFVVFIMFNGGFHYELEVECDFDFTLISNSWEKFRDHLAGDYEPI